MIEIYVTSLLIFLFGLLNLFGLNQQLFWRQLGFFIVGGILFIVVKKIGRNFFLVNYKFFYWLFFGLLSLVLFIGEEVRGARRWFHFPIYNFQPSEFFKIFFIIFLSQILIKKYSDSDRRLRFVTVLFYFILPVILIFKQPDLGTTIVLTVTFASLVLVSNLPKKYFLNLVIFLLLALPIGWWLLQPYQKDRLLSFFNPHLDRQGTAYNMIQSIVTVGSGRFLGKGLGLGTQTRLLFLPENFTDFSFASLVEQLGFFGGGTVIILFFLLAYFFVKRVLFFWAQTSDDHRQNFYYCLGVFSFLVCQIFVNIGMNLGLVPVTGITLPLISYGGSSLVSFMLALALMP